MLNLDNQLDFIATILLSASSQSYPTRQIKRRNRKLQKAKADSTKSTNIQQPARQLEISRLQPFIQYLEQPSNSYPLRNLEAVSIKVRMADSDEQLVQLLRQPQTKERGEMKEAMRKIEEYCGKNKYLLKMKNYQASNK